MQGDFIEMANLAERIFSCFKSDDSFSLSDQLSEGVMGYHPFQVQI